MSDENGEAASPPPPPPPPPTWKSQNENDGLSKYGGRDLIGFAAKPPRPKWPRKAKVALNFMIHYEEGSEMCSLHGDHISEDLVKQRIDTEAVRHLSIESDYEYGSRAGFWRLHRLFTKRKYPVTVIATGMALERNPMVCQALKELDTWEVASGGFRAFDYQEVDDEAQEDHIKRAVYIQKKLLGTEPAGFMCGKPNVATRSLVVNEKKFKYDSDSCADDLPYWTLDYGNEPHLILPWSPTESDLSRDNERNYRNWDEFASHLKKTLKFLVDEGKSSSPRMMTVSLHCRLARPAHTAALSEFLDFVKGLGREVWVSTREAIADHWRENHFPVGAGSAVEPRDPVSTDETDEEATSKSEVLDDVKL